MQTFLPYPDYIKSLTCLDDKRLGKQRIEAFQILCALEFQPALAERLRRNPEAKPYKGWKKHPATLMWRGYEHALAAYYNSSLLVWIGRGFKNTMEPLGINFNFFTYPHWFGSEEFHNSHQSNLLRKDPNHYRKYFFSCRNDLSYVWPKGRY